MRSRFEVFPRRLGRAGRSLLYRMGRRAYVLARAECANSLTLNGERVLQQRVLQYALHDTVSIVVLDVGANVGEWSTSLIDLAVALKCDARIRLHAFEPAPEAAARCRATLLAIASAAEIHVENIAASDQCGFAQLRMTAATAGTNSLACGGGEDEINAAAGRFLPVRTSTIDNYLAASSIAAVALLKIDTEGHDMRVLYGAQQSLRDGRIAIAQFEYNHRWIQARMFLRDAFEFAQDLNLGIGKLTSRGIEGYRAWHAELERFFEGNYVLWDRSREAALPITWIAFDRSNAMYEA